MYTCIGFFLIIPYFIASRLEVYFTNHQVTVDRGYVPNCLWEN